MHDAYRIYATAKINELQRLIDACKACENNALDMDAYVDVVRELADFTRLIAELANRRLLDLTYGYNRRA